MRKLDRRMGKLELRFGVADPLPVWAFRIHSVDSDGCVVGTTVISSDSKMRVLYQDVQGTWE